MPVAVTVAVFVLVAGPVAACEGVPVAVLLKDMDGLAVIIAVPVRVCVPVRVPVGERVAPGLPVCDPVCAAVSVGE